MKTKKESFCIYTLIINVLSSLFKENNEQASLLYKLFKMYSGKQEQKWLNVIFHEPFGEYSEMNNLN